MAISVFLNTFMIGAAIVQDYKHIWSLLRSGGLIHQLSAMQVLIVPGDEIKRNPEREKLPYSLCWPKQPIYPYPGHV